MAMRWFGPLVAVGITACAGLEEPEKFPTAVLRVFAQAGDAGQYGATVEATFLNTARAQYPDSRDVSDLCQLAGLVNLPVTSLENLDAGDSVAFTTDAGTVYLYPRTDLAGNEAYRPATALVSLTPGKPVTFAIPGAAGGFPGTALTALTAPVITQLSPIPTATSTSDSLIVTWALAGDDSSRFEISLQFATEGSTVLNRQVLCQWRDDGSGAIPGSLLTEWATTAIRRIEVSRYRTVLRDLESGAVLYFLATYDLTQEPVP